MPLKKGKSQETVGKNIKELEHSYKKTGKIGTSKPKSKKAAHKQATAIALNKAGKSKVNKESYDNLVNEYLKTYLLEMPYIEFEGGRENVAPEEIEGVIDQPDLGDNVDPQEMYDMVAKVIGDQKASMMSGEEIEQYYHDIMSTGSEFPEEDSETSDHKQEDREFNEWLKQKFKDRPGFLRNLAYDQDMVMDLFYDFKQERAQAQSGEEDYEEECESAKEGCKCNNCPECQSNQEQGKQMLSFYGFK